MAGIRKLGVIHRGFTTFEKKQYRNDPQWQIAIELRSKFPTLPFFVDPSHIAGHTDYVRAISQRALDLGFDGLMIESHCSPSEALSDSSQQLTPAQLDDMLNHQLEVRNIDSDSPQWKENIHELRAKIDVIDESILAALSSRMQISRQIGQYKKENNIAILQTSRWDAVLAKVIEKGRGYGLSEKCITDIFNTIHEESVEAQNQILSDSSSRQK
jgi:chorismate mutase